MTTITGYDWVLRGHADWEPRDSCVELVYDDHMWIMGGWFHQSEPNPRDVWKSADGLHWTKVLQEAPWVMSDLPLGLVHDGRMWHMGGRSLPGTACSQEVYATRDGVAWEQVTAQAGWSPRLGSGGVSFGGRMWLYGGTSDFYHSNPQTLSNDIWSSADGVTWTCHAGHAPWSPRAYAKVVELHGRLYLIGGGGCNEGAFCHNDVWTSDNGVDWTCILPAAPWLPRIWHGVVVYRDLIWVLAGDNIDGVRMLNDVWCSADGVHWHELQADTVFSLRHEISPYVFADQIWVTGGHAMPLSNEIWTLSLPESFTPE